jgi:hypothetical protein
VDTAAAWATCTKKLSAFSCQPSARTGAPLLAAIARSGVFSLIGADAIVPAVEQSEACRANSVASEIANEVW